MKRLFAALAVFGACAAAQADVYNDATGDTFTNAGGGILDILSLEVTNNASTISFKFTLAGDVDATDWGKYLLILDTAPGGDTVGNGWGRPISMTSGADYWIGSWVDGGNGVQSFAYNGAWNSLAANGPFAGPGGTPANSPDVGITKMGNMVTITASLASLGLDHADVVLFDAFTSGGGGGDGAIDSLGNPNQQVGDWGNASNANPVAYTIFIPAPGAFGLLAAGGLVALRRRR